MGTWGTSLYDNDLAADVRDDNLDKLRRGLTNEQATNELTQANSDNDDPDEEVLFWLALADTQWNYGRLLPEVMAKAQFYLSQDNVSECWNEAGEKELSDWKSSLEQLKRKLELPQPQPKRVSKYRLYQCKWNMGDVFAYRFTGDYSKEKGFIGKDVIFRKVSEDTWWPGHIIPVVQIYKWIGDEIPPTGMLRNFDLLPITYKSNRHKPVEYNVALISESEKAIPKENLTFLGNLPGNDIIPFRGHDFWSGYQFVGWESSKYNTKFEHFVIDMYLSWRDI